MNRAHGCGVDLRSVEHLVRAKIAVHEASSLTRLVAFQGCEAYSVYEYDSKIQSKD